MHYNSTILKLANNQATLALSMGTDSVACAHFLKLNCRKLNLSLFHFNHQLRDENDEMESKAKEFASFLDLPLIIKRRKDLVGEVNPNIFSEAGLRKMRYSAMKDLGYVIVCHHLDDAVENYMFNVLNGKENYLPMPVVTVWDEHNFTVIRPFIFNSKIDIERYVDNNDLSDFVVRDKTNDDTVFRRNWLRHDILPSFVDKGYNLQTIVTKRYRKYLTENFS